MSWLARSIANSLRIDDDEDDDEDSTTTSAKTYNSQSHQEPLEESQEFEEEEDDESDNQGRGVKEDLSELRETLARQIWGVASFLAPPPQLDSNPTLSHHYPDPSVSDRNRWDSSVRSGSGDVSDEDPAGSVGDYSGDRDNFAYIHDNNNNNSSRFNDNRLNSRISRFSNFLPFRPDDEIADAIGVTEEVLAFAGNIAHHPETWLDFPLSEEEDVDDFDMSDAQCKHALAVERLAPRLAALRIELCPAHMSEGYFWKVYFVLLHSRLNKHDDELLSTPQIVAARAMWMKELQKRTKPEPDWFGQSTLYSTESTNSLHEDFGPTSSDSAYGNVYLGPLPFAPTTYYATTDFHTEKHSVVGSDQMIDKSVIKEEPAINTTDKEVMASSSYKLPVQDYDDDDGDSWLEEHSELDGYNGTAVLLGTDEDVSFSDLEDGNDFSVPMKSKKVIKDSDMSAKPS
ncbi:hypothetical protein LguiA_006554 [Lonicera macranthoides]